jgi:hypothetical protein
MTKYQFLVEVEYNGDEPYTDEIEDALKDKYPHANFRVQRAAQQGVQPTIATAALEDSPFETGIRRNAVVLSNRNSG